MDFTQNVLEIPGKPDLQRYSDVAINQVKVITKFGQIWDFFLTWLALVFTYF